MMNQAYIKEIESLKHRLEELRDSTIISMTYRQYIRDKVIELDKMLQYWIIKEITATKPKRKKKNEKL